MTGKIQIKIISAIIFTQVSIFVAIISFQSLGSIPRWDLLDQISMADRIIMGLDMYPDFNGTDFWGVSVYFPGVALLAAFLMEMVPQSSIVLVMLFIASAVTFLTIAMQKAIVYSIHEDYDSRNFWPVMLIIALTVCHHWLMYAAEFKPDSLAYLIGATCVLAHQKIIKKPVIALALGVIAGGALIFKQQYIAFVFGYIFYFIVTKNEKDKLFAAGILTGALLVIVYTFTKQSMFFWTVSVLSDDGYLSIHEWLRAHFRFGVPALVALFGIFCLRYLHKLNFDATRFLTISRGFINKPFPWIISFSFILAVISSWKVGGNSGNTAFGLLLLSPLILIILEKTDRKILIAISALAILLHLPNLVNGQTRLDNINTFKNEAEAVLHKHCSGLVVGSNLYYAVRDIYSGCDYQNYWTHSVRNNTNNLTLGHEVMSLILDESNTIFVVENFQKNNAIFSARDDFKVIFENEIGIIAVRQ